MAIYTSMPLPVPEMAVPPIPEELRDARIARYVKEAWIETMRRYGHAQGMWNFADLGSPQFMVCVLGALNLATAPEESAVYAKGWGRPVMYLGSGLSSWLADVNDRCNVPDGDEYRFRTKEEMIAVVEQIPVTGE